MTSLLFDPSRFLGINTSQMSFHDSKFKVATFLTNGAYLQNETGPPIKANPHGLAI
jgi:hypothetical protein